jgi:UDP-glucose-4-epimerase GalE
MKSKGKIMSKAVLVAGGAGYIGSHTCKLLAQMGYFPITIDNLSMGYEAAVKWGPLIKADIRDEAAVLDAIRTYDITSAIHFAAFAYVGESVHEPVKYYDNNVTAALTFAASLIKGGVKALVFSSTCATYGTPNVNPIPETHPQNPINPYGDSKLAFERTLPWLERAHGLKHVILRYFNAAGADIDGEIGESHDPETHLIPLLVQAALGKGDPLTVFGSDYDTPDGTAVRDYIHVTDLASAHIAAIERLLSGGESATYNVGTGIGVSVLDLIKASDRVLGLKVPYIMAGRREGDPYALVADPSKIKQDLNWAPRFSDADTLLRTASQWQKTRPY